MESTIKIVGRVLTGDVERLLDTIDTADVRSFGPVDPRDPRIAGEIMSLAGLIKERREAIAGFPLTVVVHDWGTTVASYFIAALGPLLDEQDALWLVSGEMRLGTSSTPDRWLELELGNDIDLRLYKMLIADIVYFGGQPADVPRVQSWSRRARATIVDQHGIASGDAIVACQGAQLSTYLLNDAGSLLKR